MYHNENSGHGGHPIYQLRHLPVVKCIPGLDVLPVMRDLVDDVEGADALVPLPALLGVGDDVPEVLGLLPAVPMPARLETHHGLPEPQFANEKAREGHRGPGVHHGLEEVVVAQVLDDVEAEALRWLLG